MNWFIELFTGHSIAHCVFILCVAIFSGVLIGKIQYKGISLGIGGVLFSGIILGHFKFGMDKEILEFVREFGLVLFVYTIGIQVGPAFFASLKKQGIKLNMLAVVIVASSVFAAVCVYYFMKLPLPVAVGIMSGAVTNTPGLGAAQQALKEVYPDSQGLAELAGLGYAMAYPMGVFCVIMSMVLCRKIFRVDVPSEVASFRTEQRELSGAPSDHTLIVSNPRIAGKTIEKLASLVEGNFCITQIFRNNSAIAPKGDTALEMGDVIKLVCGREKFEDIALLLGDITEFDLKSLPSAPAHLAVSVTHRDAMKKSIGEHDFPGRFNVAVMKVERAGIELMPFPSFRLQFGDIVHMSGETSSLNDVAKILGNSEKELEHPKILPLFIGIASGIILGVIPVTVPGFSVPVKLGIAGGPLVMAMLLSTIRQIGPLSWHMPASANLILREIGITLFLACVGLKAGEHFFDTLLRGQGLQWVFCGMLVTLFPMIVIVILGRLFLKMNYPSLCGLMAGSMTDPPALSFALQSCACDAPALTYATVYALAMVLRIILAQLFIIVLSAL